MIQISGKGLISEIYKEHWKLNKIKTENNLIEKWAEKYLNRYFTKHDKTYLMILVFRETEVKPTKIDHYLPIKRAMKEGAGKMAEE